MAPQKLEGMNLGKYQLREQLGHGGMASVYRAYHPQLDRFVAIKVLRGELVDDPEFLAGLGVTPGEYAVYVGRLVPEKGAHYLIDAWKRIATDKKLLIVGDTSFTDGYVESLKTDDERVLFCGYLYGAQLASVFRHAGLFVLPSDLEGLPIVLLESLAAAGARPELRSSEHLFFRLSDPEIVAYLRRWTREPAPGQALQPEILNKIHEWLGAEGGPDKLIDWDISRDAPYLGIPIPDEPGKYFYVWLDAPVGYLASLKSYFDSGKAKANGEPRGFEAFLVATPKKLNRLRLHLPPEESRRRSDRGGGLSVFGTLQSQNRARTAKGGSLI